MNRIKNSLYNLYINILGYGIIFGCYVLWFVFLFVSFFVRTFSSEKQFDSKMSK